jgi:hypothetical protein
MKITKSQLRILIEQYVADAEGNVTPPQQYTTSFDTMSQQTDIGKILRDIYNDAFLQVADMQYGVYEKGKSMLGNPNKIQGLHDLLSSGDPESFLQGYELVEALDLIDYDYANISNIMKELMLNDQRLEMIVSAISDYINQSAMSDSIYVDDKAYKPNEFLAAVINYMAGHDGELPKNSWPSGLARGMKLLELGPESRFFGEFLLELLGLKHIITGKKEQYPITRRSTPPSGLYPLNPDSDLSTGYIIKAFPGAKTITLGYPASREGKEEYGLAQSTEPVVVLYCDIYCSAEEHDPDTRRYYSDDLGPLISDIYGLNFAEYDGGGCVIMGNKSVFEDAIKEVNGRYAKRGFKEISAGDYEELIRIFLYEADDSYSGGGFNAPCSGYLGGYDEFYFPDYEREAKKDLNRLLYDDERSAETLEDVTARKGKAASEHIVDILSRHIGNDEWPEWDPERKFPVLIAALAADASGFLPDLYEQIANELDDTVEQTVYSLAYHLYP